MEAEFEELDRNNSWTSIYQYIRNEASKYKYTNKEARKPENKSLNRYRDVTPFDHSRVCLSRGGRDYINASLVNVHDAHRAYILTQGPLPSTIQDFWLMIWEQNSRAILMLNKLVEKGAVKCHMYWPEEEDLQLTDVMLKISFINMERTQDYISREFLLTDLESGESRTIYQFHYISWPDFGLPESPVSFLNYLNAVRESGLLDIDQYGPAIVHCSAGIGRSGTFCLVDTCLVLMKKSGVDIDLQKVLLEMRKYRMGLIQTPEQLRFSYLAIIEGAKKAPIEVPSNPIAIMNGNRDNEPIISDDHVENELNSKDEITPPVPVLPQKKGISQSLSDNELDMDNASTKSSDGNPEKSLSAKPLGSPTNNNLTSNELRRRIEDKQKREENRLERNKKLEEKITKIKEKQKDHEARSQLKMRMLKIGCISLGVVFMIGTGYLFYKNYIVGDSLSIRSSHS